MGFFSLIAAKWRKFYLNYSMVTALYMMEPLERKVINTIVVIMFATMLYSSWVYLPHYTVKTLSYLTGVISREGASEATMASHSDFDIK